MSQQSVKAAKPNAWQRLMRYFGDVGAELRRVVWPSRDEIISSSWIVVITLAIFIVMIFIFDQLSSAIIGFLAQVGG
jgi:preprotein translocase subunit SecE